MMGGMAETTTTEEAAGTEAIAETEAAEMVATGGNGPGDALYMGSDAARLDPGETRWYVFEYDAGESSSDNQQAFVELAMEYEGSMAFEVWTPDNVRSWANGEEKFDEWSPVGQGANLGDQTGKDADDETLIWAGVGRLNASETFYVLVKNITNQAVDYTLNISGPNTPF